MEGTSKSSPHAAHEYVSPPHTGTVTFPEQPAATTRRARFVFTARPLSQHITAPGLGSYLATTCPPPVITALTGQLHRHRRRPDRTPVTSALTAAVRIRYRGLQFLYRVSHNWCHTLAQFLFHSHSVRVRGISSGLATRASLGIRQSSDFSSTETLTNQRVHRGDFHGVQGARDPGV